MGHTRRQGARKPPQQRSSQAALAALPLTSAPANRIRGHQLGYRPKTNSYDGWSPQQYECVRRPATTVVVRLSKEKGIHGYSSMPGEMRVATVVCAGRRGWLQ